MIDMRIESELTLRLIDAGGDEDEPVSEILLNGQSTARRVTGAVLEGAVQWTNCHLLFVTDDVPYEEMLRIVLLDSAFSTMDSARIGSPYSSGSFSGLTLVEPNTVRFRFIGDTDWRVELLPRPQLRMPFFSEPPGVYRAFGLSRHFVVHGNPQPQRG